MALITPAQVRTLYSSLTGTIEDSRLTDLIAWADELIAAYCGYPVPDAGGGRTLEDTTYTLFGVPSLEDPRVLVLGLHPIVSVTSVHVDDGLDYDADSLVDPADYTAYLARGELVAPASSTTAWSTSPRANRVVCVAGFASTPPGLVAIAAAAVRDLLDLGKVGQQTSGSSSRQSYSRPEAESLLSPAVRGALDGTYKLWGSHVA